MDKIKFNTESIYFMYKKMYCIIDMERNIVLNEVKEVLENSRKIDQITKVESRIKS